MENTDMLLFAQKEEMAQCLAELIRIPSLKDTPEENAPFGRENARALSHMLDLCEKMGFAVKNLGGYAGYAETGEGEMLGILVHLDVVPAQEGWHHDPFAGVIENGYIVGRGAQDNKGPAVAAIYALHAVKQAGVHLNKRVRIIFGCDEESGWGCMDHYREVEEMPAMAFSPDAEFPVINTEKGIYHAKITFPAVPGRQIEVHAGSRPNVVCDFAKATLSNAFGVEELPEAQVAGGENITVTALGEGGHASTPWLGDSALTKLMRALGSLAAPETAPFAALASLFSDYYGSGINLACKDEVSGPLTVNLGTLTYNENGGEAWIDIRHPVTLPATRVRAALSAALPEGWVFTEGHLQAPHHVEAEHPLVKTLLGIYEKYTGLKGKPIAIGGGTYARTIPTAVAFGPIFEGEESLAHKPNERMSVESLLKNAQIYAAAIIALAAGE